MVMKVSHRVMLIGFLGLLLDAASAWGQTACGPEFVGNSNFCNITKIDASVPPSPPATDMQKPPQPTAGYPLRFTFILLCSDFFDGHLLNCGYSVEILKLIDPDPAPDPAFPRKNLGGHVLEAHIPGVHPLIEPKDTGNLIFAGFPDSSGTVTGSPPNPPKMTGNTGQNVAVVLYPVTQSSGDLLVEQFMIMPPGYLCGFPGCFDQVNGAGVPTRFGLNRMQFITTLHVGIPLDSQLTVTPDDPFVLSGQTTAHPDNHFGTATAVALIRQIAEAYLDNQPGCKDPAVRPTCPRLSINDLSLVRGGVYDLNKQWFGDNQGNPHWGHRTGTEADIDTKDSQNNDTSCIAGGGGNDRVEKAVKAVIPDRFIPTFPQGTTQFLNPVFAHKCEPRTEAGGRNHVYLQ
jgi:hypothetical protein